MPIPRVQIRLTRKKALPRRVIVKYIERSVALGLALLVPAGILFTVSAFVGGPIGVLLATLGGALFTVAVLSCLYDPFLRNVLTQEIFDKVGLKSTLSQLGLIEVFTSGSVNYSTLFSGAEEIIAVPYNPDEWAKGPYLELLKIAAQHPVSLTVYVPVHDDPWPPALADRLTLEVEMVRSTLRSFPNALVTAWDADTRHPKSMLKVFYYGGLPGLGLTYSNTVTQLDLGPAIRYPISDRSSRSFIFESNSAFGTWAHTQVAFQGGALPPTQADQRPLPMPPRTKTLAVTTQDSSEDPIHGN